ncbi:MAG: DUF5362 family protein [Microbacteriaceae bacterium]
MADQVQSPPPGWYHDSHAVNQGHRWWNGEQWTDHWQLETRSPLAQPAPTTHPSVSSDELTIRRIADYTRLSGVLWLILGILQVLFIITALIGIWNIIAALGRLHAAKLTLARDPSIPGLWQGVAGLIIIGILNLLLGGMIGLLFVALDFVVRDQVLKNRHLFDAPPLPA